MITKTHCASNLFVVRRRGALIGNPMWADLTIDSNRALSKESARGPGLYAIHFRGTFLYVGKFCGKRSNPFDGRVCDIRWSRHIGTLTLRDRRISLSEGRCKQLRGSSVAPLVDIVNALEATSIHQNRGRATSINRVLFAAEQWAEFARIEDASGLEDFSITYTQLEIADGIDRTSIRSVVSQAEKMAIDRLQPRCNGEVREGCGKNATITAVAEVLNATLKQAIAMAGEGDQPPPPTPPDPVVGISDDGEPPGGGQSGGHGHEPEDPDDPVDETAEEMFWGRIENELEAQTAANLLIDALAGVADADFHFTETNTADLRVHSLAGPRARFNVACLSWQPRLRRFICEIYLQAETCLALGASIAGPNHAGKRLPTLAIFDHDCEPDALCRCGLAALNLYRQDNRG